MVLRSVIGGCPWFFGRLSNFDIRAHAGGIARSCGEWMVPDITTNQFNRRPSKSLVASRVDDASFQVAMVDQAKLGDRDDRGCRLRPSGAVIGTVHLWTNVEYVDFDLVQCGVRSRSGCPHSYARFNRLRCGGKSRAYSSTNERRPQLYPTSLSSVLHEHSHGVMASLIECLRIHGVEHLDGVLSGGTREMQKNRL